MKHDTIRCKETYSREDVPKIIDDQREQSKREECNRNLVRETENNLKKTLKLNANKLRFYIFSLFGTLFHVIQ